MIFLGSRDDLDLGTSHLLAPAKPEFKVLYHLNNRYKLLVNSPGRTESHGVAPPQEGVAMQEILQKNF